MEGTHLHLTVTTVLAFLVLNLLQTSVHGEACKARDSVTFNENNEVDDLVETIELQPGASVSLTSPVGPGKPFNLNGNRLVAAIVFDAEKNASLTARLLCTPAAPASMFPFTIIVIVGNLNDNPPIFTQTLYQFKVNELLPQNTEVGRVEAQDLDNLPLYYRLDRNNSGFKLLSPTVPKILVETPLDYDNVKKVTLTLFVQDTPLTPSNTEPSYTNSTTVEITILDVDNRPPWFQPCTKYVEGGNVICSSSGYTGHVTLNKIEPGDLKLNPGPLYAIDGDSGINEEITYKIVGGNDDNLFKIESETGNITMLTETNTFETITLTVLATQKDNSFQVSTTFITIKVLTESLHPPVFQRPQYQGTVTGVGNMALDIKNEPLQFIATDADYAATGGINPNITYYVKDNSNFSIIRGYLFMTKNLPEATLNLQVVARDTGNGETVTADLLLEVKSGPTIAPPTTTNDKTTDNVPPTSASTSTDGTGLTTTPSDATIIPSASTAGLTTTPLVTATNPSMSTMNSSTEGSGATTEASPTSNGSVPTANTAHPQTVIVPSGVYGPSDMAALGATLGVLLCAALVAMGFLIVHIRRDRGDWKKIYETNRFRSTLNNGLGGEKEGIQYTNDAFSNDEDGRGSGSGSPNGKTVISPKEPRAISKDLEMYLTPEKPSVSIQDDGASQSGSEGDDKEKEVKPILTKGRRQDEGYKSVWFKEDIDPEAKEEVVIIPDSRENDSDEEDEEQTDSKREVEKEGKHSVTKTPKTRVGFKDADSGEEDSQDEEVLTVDI